MLMNFSPEKIPEFLKFTEAQVSSGWYPMRMQLLMVSNLPQSVHYKGTSFSRKDAIEP